MATSQLVAITEVMFFVKSARNSGGFVAVFTVIDMPEYRPLFATRSWHDNSYTGAYMMDFPEGSVTQCIAKFKQGDQGAFDKIWGHYFDDLIKVARKYLSNRPAGALVDEDDIVQNALWSVCKGLPKNKSYDNVDSRENLWPILVAITKYKVTDHMRREGAQKRGGGKVYNELQNTNSSDDGDRGLANIVPDESPKADDLMAMSEQLAILMDLLPKDDLKAIAKLHIESWKNTEIAEKLGISTRGVERKLKLIRDTWYEWWQKQEE